VVYFKVVKKGAGVSYGHRWTAPHDTRVVTVPIGYGDGFLRQLSQKIDVLIKGKRYPQVGNICMDQMMVNIGDGEAFNGDEVVLIGEQHGEAIAVEELADVGVDTFIRVGTSGSMQHHIKPGSVGVISGAIRDEGTSRHYLPMEFPAVADLDITLALREAAKESGFPWYVGIAQSKDSFYGQHNPERMPIAEDLQRRWKAWMAGGAICSEMEAATLYIVAATLRVRAGGAMLILGNPDQRPMTEAEIADSNINRVIDTSIAGLRKLIAADRAAGRIK
jgi:uridine phosphorylase